MYRAVTGCIIDRPCRVRLDCQARHVAKSVNSTLSQACVWPRCKNSWLEYWRYVAANALSHCRRLMPVGDICLSYRNSNNITTRILFRRAALCSCMHTPTIPDFQELPDFREPRNVFPSGGWGWIEWSKSPCRMQRWEPWAHLNFRDWKTYVSDSHPSRICICAPWTTRLLMTRSKPCLQRWSQPDAPIQSLHKDPVQGLSQPPW